jgi:hypothetical protein
LLSLVKGARFPFLILVSMRGDYGEGNPWQYPMGQAVEPVLAAMGVICLRIERPEEVAPTVTAALIMVFQSGAAVAAKADRRQAVLRSTPMATHDASGMAGALALDFVLDRAQAVPARFGRHEDFLIIAGLAGTAREMAALIRDGAHSYALAARWGRQRPSGGAWRWRGRTSACW